jgi:hypothetical protein
MPAGCNPGLKEKFIFDGVKNAIPKTVSVQSLKNNARATFQHLDNLSKHKWKIMFMDTPPDAFSVLGGFFRFTRPIRQRTMRLSHNIT